MKTLHLLRHAKSSWKDEGLDDRARPLSKRGKAAAKAMAKYMEQAGIRPDLVLCSTAVRTRETLKPVAKRLKPAKVIFTDELYEFSGRKLWKPLNALPEDAESVLLVGHNPAFHELALALADVASAAKLPPAEGKFATAALATFSVAGRWKDLAPHAAQAIGFVDPKSIEL